MGLPNAKESLTSGTLQMVEGEKPMPHTCPICEGPPTNNHAAERALARDLRTRVNRSFGEAAADAIDWLCDENRTENEAHALFVMDTSERIALKEAENTALRAKLVTMTASGTALADKLDAICQASEYRSVFTLAMIHGAAYSGPTFEHELRELHAALEAIKEADNAK